MLEEKLKARQLWVESKSIYGWKANAPMSGKQRYLWVESKGIYEWKAKLSMGGKLELDGK
jgi:hypothetical protein